MRKNSSTSSHLDDEIFLGDLKEMSEDDFFTSHNRSARRKANERKIEARRKIERYNEDKELAGWLDDSHLEK
ncbi:MAG: hypothetical protein MK188_00245 [Gammaproteobacteria bacterium]|nr:hypothetical protein [Gammaproteobacteria bacterium]